MTTALLAPAQVDVFDLLRPPPHRVYDLRLGVGPGQCGTAFVWPLPAEDIHRARLGTLGLFHGVEVIGYLGIATRLGYRTNDGEPAVQTAWLNASRASWFPRPVFTVASGGRNMQLFDWPAVRGAAIQVGALAPDGVTPIKRRPRRGPARKPA